MENAVFRPQQSLVQSSESGVQLRTCYGASPSITWQWYTDDDGHENRAPQNVHNLHFNTPLCPRDPELGVSAFASAEVRIRVLAKVLLFLFSVACSVALTGSLTTHN